MYASGGGGKNGKRGVLGHGGLYVALFGFMLVANVCSLVLMFFQGCVLGICCPNFHASFGSWKRQGFMLACDGW